MHEQTPGRRGARRAGRARLGRRRPPSPPPASESAWTPRSAPLPFYASALCARRINAFSTLFVTAMFGGSPPASCRDNRQARAEGRFSEKGRSSQVWMFPPDREFRPRWHQGSLSKPRGPNRTKTAEPKLHTGSFFQRSPFLYVNSWRARDGVHCFSWTKCQRPSR